MTYDRLGEMESSDHDHGTSQNSQELKLQPEIPPNKGVLFPGFQTDYNSRERFSRRVLHHGEESEYRPWLLPRCFLGAEYGYPRGGAGFPFCAENHPNAKLVAS